MAPRRIVPIPLWGLVSAFVGITAAFVFGLVLVTNASDRAKHAAEDAARVQTKLCDRVDHLDATIVDTLQRQQKALPFNAYYREHPDELAQAQRETLRAITAFQGNAC